MLTGATGAAVPGTLKNHDSAGERPFLSNSMLIRQETVTIP